MALRDFFTSRWRRRSSPRMPAPRVSKRGSTPGWGRSSLRSPISRSPPARMSPSAPASTACAAPRRTARRTRYGSDGRWASRRRTAHGRSRISTNPCPSTWTVRCAPPSISNRERHRPRLFPLPQPPDLGNPPVAFLEVAPGVEKLERIFLVREGQRLRFAKAPQRHLGWNGLPCGPVRAPPFEIGAEAVLPPFGNMLILERRTIVVVARKEPVIHSVRTYPAFAITPPSTTWIEPVTKLARSEAR